MAQMIFFKRSGCQESEKQQAILEDAGHDLQCTDILSRTWTREELLPFVRGHEPLRIMNTRAAQIRRGQLDPLLLSFEQALSLMIDSPELIKGPLIAVDGLYFQGPSDRRLQRYLDNQEKNDKITDRPQLRVLYRSTRRLPAQHLAPASYLQSSFG